jgi:acetyl-CoA carboxylase/biotin carboxylase 1
MATPEDMNANAEYIRMADQVVDVPGGTNNKNYANVSLICEIAERLKVDAVMPMWGHASENPSLPTSLAKLKHRVTFIGPPAEPMQALGDKIGSTIIAQSAGVPTIAWNGDSLTVDYKKTGIPESVYDSANVKTAEEAILCAERIGFPVMIKASEGGGGKGIRKVLRTEDVANCFRQVQGEIPGSPIFVMKMASKARHLEVQLLADKHGEAIALSGRDCSVQRRHQKIIEEGPPIVAAVPIFRKMERAAVSLAKTVGYINAGTVEYLYMEETEDFAFLELNPRLQVEHPVTENILGINLPACQLQVAMGIPLSRIADIRRLYGRHPRGRDSIDFEYAERAAPPRHCIAVRITAENPEAGFQPTSGKIKELQFKSSIDVWGYFSVDSSGLIHEFADSQFGHIFAGGRDRESARRAMIVALKELQIRGDIRTTVEYIIKMLQAEDFVANRIDTSWLDGRLSNYKELALIENRRYCPPPTLVITCGAALQGFQHFDQRDKAFINMLKVGQVPTKDSLSPAIAIDLIFENVKYKTTCVQNSPERIIVTCNHVSQLICIRPLADGGYLLNVGGRTHLVYSQVESGGLRMILDGHTCMFTPEYDPTKFSSTVAGKIARLLVEDGSHVNAGEAFVEIEVMKMYMPFKAQESGTVHFQKSEGATLSPGDIIAKFTLDNPDLVVRAEEFKGNLYQESVEIEEDAKKPSPSLRLAESSHDLDKVLEGYPLTDEAISTALKTFVASKRDRLLPVFKVEEALSILRGRIDPDLSNAIHQLNLEYQKSLTGDPHEAYPAAKVLSEIYNYAQDLPNDRRAAFSAQISDLWSVVETFLFSSTENILSSLGNFLESYLLVERQFDNMSFTDVVNQLRKDFQNNLDKVLHLCRSHANIKAKNHLILKVLELMKSFSINVTTKRPELPAGIVIRSEPQIRKLKARLTDMSKLRQPIYSHISFAANLLLVDQFSMTAENRRHRLNDAVIAAISTGESVGHSERVDELQKFIDSNIVIHDLLIESLRQDSDYQLATLELYARKIYQRNHSLFNMNAGNSLNPFELGKLAWISFDFLTHFMSYDDSLLADSTLKDKNISFSDLSALARSSASSTHEKLSGGGDGSREVRSGVFATIESLSELPKHFPLILDKISSDEKTQMVNVIHVIILSGPSSERSDDDTSSLLSNFLQSQQRQLKKRFIRRVTFFVGKSDQSSGGKAKPPLPSIFTFRDRLGFTEDKLFRNVEASLAFHLDLHRFSNFNIRLAEGVETTSGNALLYRAVPKNVKGPSRFFARIVCFTADTQNSDVETLFVEALDQLSLALGLEEAAGKGKQQHKTNSTSAANHFYINVVSPDSVLSPDFIESLLKRICTKYWYKMVRLAVTTVELKLTARLSADAAPLSIRFVASNPTGYVLKVDKYCEISVDGVSVFKSLSKGSHKGPWDGLNVLMPYEITQKFENQRAEALTASDTLYVHDWPILFESATEKLWAEVAQEKVPEEPFQCRELVFFDGETGEPFESSWTAREAQDRGELRPVAREPGLNDCGMVAWHMTLRTPEYPDGRDMVVICNDITFQAGSFGTREDILFFKVSNPSPNLHPSNPR